MQAMLLSDQKPLLAGLRNTLAALGRDVMLCRSTSVGRSSPWGRRRSGGHGESGPMDVVFVDLDWCGLPRLSEVTKVLRREMGQSAVVVLVDRPEQVAQVYQANVDADLLVAKNASPTVVCRSVERFVGRSRLGGLDSTCDVDLDALGEAGSGQGEPAERDDQPLATGRKWLALIWAAKR